MVSKCCLHYNVWALFVVRFTLMKGLDMFLSERECQSGREHTESYSNTGHYMCAVVSPFLAPAIALPFSPSPVDLHKGNERIQGHFIWRFCKFLLLKYLTSTLSWYSRIQSNLTVKSLALLLAPKVQTTYWLFFHFHFVTVQESWFIFKKNNFLH
jgi:hypothetical protein